MGNNKWTALLSSSLCSMLLVCFFLNMLLAEQINEWMNDMSPVTKVKQSIHKHKDKSCNPKNHKDKLTAQPGCVNCFC